jgi:hypothetical protein
MHPNHPNASALKPRLRAFLHHARNALRAGDVSGAREALLFFRAVLPTVPPSTRRRWRCGK